MLLELGMKSLEDAGHAVALTFIALLNKVKMYGLEHAINYPNRLFFVGFFVSKYATKCKIVGSAPQIITVVRTC